MNNLNITNVTEFYNQVRDGKLDDNLGFIIRTCEDRQAKLSGVPDLHNLKRGQRLWFNDKVRPTYLIHQEVEVVEVKRVRVVVKLVNPDSIPSETRFQGNIRSPLDMLQVTKP